MTESAVGDGAVLQAGTYWLTTDQVHRGNTGMWLEIGPAVIVSAAAGEGPRLRLQKAAPLVSVGRVPEREMVCR